MSEQDYQNNSRYSTLQSNNYQSQLLSTHFGKLLDKNEAFFNHLKGDCICGRCICGQCKCPKMLLSNDFKKGQESLYQRNFIAHGKQKQIPLIDHNVTYKSQLPMDINTIQRSTYQAHTDAKPAESLKPEQKVFLIPFSSSSAYRLDYTGGGMSSLKINPPHHPTVVDIPMTTHSTYQDNFYKKPIPREEFLTTANKSSFKSPISPELPFIHQSTNSAFYKPYQTGKLNRNDPEQNVRMIPAFDGQFNSTTQKDFDDKNPKKCPSRVFLNSLYKQKLQQIA
ncbi:unnamed protein product [Paramecium primaurelia]|uniref:STOP protein n=1 Tax=Paramecium primaurelia TaxID=5886 RepID=A0A8S1QJJ7_PARPR|nr:unnamed protein product [Paramecium primaurelia]